MVITDEMCRKAIEAMAPDRIQGFSTPSADRKSWGAPHTVRDVWQKPGEQLLWKGDSHDEMMERCRVEEMRLGLQAAFSFGQSQD